MQIEEGVISDRPTDLYLKDWDKGVYDAAALLRRIHSSNDDVAYEAGEALDNWTIPNDIELRHQYAGGFVTILEYWADWNAKAVRTMGQHFKRQLRESALVAAGKEGE